MFRLSHRRLFTLTRSVIIPTLCAVLLAFSAVSEAGSKPLNYTASGGFEQTPFSYFPDGAPSGSITLAGTSTSGPITVHEWAAASANGNTCTPPSGVPNAGLQATYSDSLEIITFKATGDFLIQNLVSGTICIDLTSASPPFPFYGILTVSNVGGTGKFAGATGTETLNFAGQFLSCGATLCVGYVRHDETGKVTTP